jgi:hypothetical protein
MIWIKVFLEVRFLSDGIKIKPVLKERNMYV